MRAMPTSQLSRLAYQFFISNHFRENCISFFSTLFYVPHVSTSPNHPSMNKFATLNSLNSTPFYSYKLWIIPRNENTCQDGVQGTCRFMNVSKIFKYLKYISVPYSMPIVSYTCICITGYLSAFINMLIPICLSLNPTEVCILVSRGLFSQYLH